MRTEKIELALMEAVQRLSAITTHMHMKKCLPPEYIGQIQMALSAVTSARDVLRNDIGSRQRSLTTRGNKDHVFNRHHLWSCNAIPEWVCSLCHGTVKSR